MKKFFFFLFVFPILSYGQEFSNSFLVKVNGENIDIKTRRVAPVFYDYDRDGIKDLIIGTVTGEFYFYKNIGTNIAIRYTRPVKLKSNGVVLKVPNW